MVLLINVLNLCSMRIQYTVDYTLVVMQIMSCSKCLSLVPCILFKKRKVHPMYSKASKCTQMCMFGSKNCVSEAQLHEISCRNLDGKRCIRPIFSIHRNYFMSNKIPQSLFVYYLKFQYQYPFALNFNSVSYMILSYILMKMKVKG